jgi:hypothetical protein
MYHEFATDPKVQMLSEADQRRFVMLLCLRCCNGDVTLQDADVAFQLRISEPDWLETKGRLIARNLIDGGNKPTAWEARQKASDSSKSRVYKHRAKAETAVKRGCNVTETVQSKIESKIEIDNTPLPPDGGTGEVIQFEKPTLDWRTAFGTADDHEGVEVVNGELVLVNGTRQRWLAEFGGDDRAMANALKEAHAAVNPGSRKSLKVQVEAKLANIVRDLNARRNNALAIAAQREKPKKPFKPSRWALG